jgi:hypothetical protein
MNSIESSLSLDFGTIPLIPINGSGLKKYFAGFGSESSGWSPPNINWRIMPYPMRSFGDKSRETSCWAGISVGAKRTMALSMI